MARVEACQIELTPVGAQARGGQVAVYDVVTNESGAVADLKRRIIEGREHMTALARLDQFEPCIRRWQFGSPGKFMVILLGGNFDIWRIEVRRDSQLFRLEVPVARSAR